MHLIFYLTATSFDRFFQIWLFWISTEEWSIVKIRQIRPYKCRLPYWSCRANNSSSTQSRRRGRNHVKGRLQLNSLRILRCHTFLQGSAKISFFFPSLIHGFIFRFSVFALRIPVLSLLSYNSFSSSLPHLHQQLTLFVVSPQLTEHGMDGQDWILCLQIVTTILCSTKIKNEWK